MRQIQSANIKNTELIFAGFKALFFAALPYFAGFYLKFK
jgi:hypothetical protein